MYYFLSTLQIFKRFILSKSFDALTRRKQLRRHDTNLLKVLMTGTRQKMEERLENARRLVKDAPERWKRNHFWSFLLYMHQNHRLLVHFEMRKNIPRVCIVLPLIEIKCYWIHFFTLMYYMKWEQRKGTLWTCIKESQCIMNYVAREEKTVDDGFVNTLEDSTEEKGLDTKHIKWNKHVYW